MTGKIGGSNQSIAGSSALRNGRWGKGPGEIVSKVNFGFRKGRPVLLSGDKFIKDSLRFSVANLGLVKVGGKYLFEVYKKTLGKGIVRLIPLGGGALFRLHQFKAEVPHDFDLDPVKLKEYTPFLELPEKEAVAAVARLLRDPSAMLDLRLSVQNRQGPVGEVMDWIIRQVDGRTGLIELSVEREVREEIEELGLTGFSGSPLKNVSPAGALHKDIPDLARSISAGGKQTARVFIVHQLEIGDLNLVQGILAASNDSKSRAVLLSEDQLRALYKGNESTNDDVPITPEQAKKLGLPLYEHKGRVLPIHELANNVAPVYRALL